MDYTFVNRCDLRDPSMGKIILCKRDHEIALFGNMTAYVGLEKISEKEAKRLLIDLHTTVDQATKYNKITALIGFHKDIKHEGKILGGTQILVKGDLVYLAFDSSKYGTVNPKAVEMCLQGTGKRIEYDYLDFTFSIPLLEEFLARQGRD